VSLKPDQNYKLVYSADLIASRIKELAHDVSAWALKQSGKDILCVGILRGGAIFLSDIVRQLEISVELSFCKTVTYSSQNKQLEEDAMKFAVESVQPN